MISKEQAMTEKAFHVVNDGKCRLWRRNGQTKTWVTVPQAFRIPVKFGLYEFGYIKDTNAHLFHLASECPGESA